MSENNKGRFVQISNFRNIGVNEKPQIICINRSVNSDYIGNLVLLIGPNNSGKTNVLKALNILNEGISFKSTDLPYSISNTKETTFVKLFEDIESMNVLLTKTADKRTDLPKITFSQWKDNLKNQINSTLTNHMSIWGFNNLNNFINSGIPQIHWNNKAYLNINNFFNDLDNWTIDQFVKNQLWKTNFGKITFNQNIGVRPQPHFNRSFSTIHHNSNNQLNEETVLTSELVNELNEIISTTVKPGEILTNNEGNYNFKFFKYEDWKIDNSFFKVRYDGEWNQFFTNLLSELGIKQSDIRNGISGKQLYYNQIVSQGLKRISANFNNLFKVSDYLYQFDLFFNDESISFEINLVCQDKNSNNPNMIIPLIFEEQS